MSETADLRSRGAVATPRDRSFAAVFEGHGATDLQRLRTVQQVIGDAEVMATAIFEFPDSESIEGALASADFSALSETRDQVYKVFALRICEGH